MGIILLDKKPGITSFDSLKEIKKKLKTGKVGHTGTLDKFAQGLLIVLTGKDLKLTSWFMHCDKQYVAKICFGKETDTLDPEGQIIAETGLPQHGDVFEAIWKYKGNIMQTPPAYSAIHIDGKRASALAREGKKPQMKPRPVTIYRLELLSWQPPFAEIFVHCSSGTYIRSLARDIALAANSRGHLVELTRTKIAGFDLSGSREQGAGNSEQLTVNSEQLTVNSVDKSVISKLGLPILDISPAEAQHVRHGKPLELILCETLRTLRLNSYLALFFGEDIVAIIQKKDDKWKYGVVFN